MRGQLELVLDHEDTHEGHSALPGRGVTMSKGVGILVGVGAAALVLWYLFRQSATAAPGAVGGASYAPIPDIPLVHDEVHVPTVSNPPPSIAIGTPVGGWGPPVASTPPPFITIGTPVGGWGPPTS